MAAQREEVAGRVATTRRPSGGKTGRWQALGRLAREVTRLCRGVGLLWSGNAGRDEQFECEERPHADPGPSIPCAPPPELAPIAQHTGLLTETPTRRELTAGITALLAAAAAREALDEHGLQMAAAIEQLRATQPQTPDHLFGQDLDVGEVSATDRPAHSDIPLARLAELRRATGDVLAAHRRARQQVEHFAQLLGRGIPGGLLPTQRDDLRHFGQLLATRHSGAAREQTRPAGPPGEDLLAQARVLWCDPVLRPVAQQVALAEHWPDGWQHGPLPEHPVGAREIGEIDLGTIGGVCDKGPRKSQNQDAMAAAVLATAAGPVRIGVVTDGVSQSVEPARAAVIAANAARDHLVGVIGAYQRALTPQELHHTLSAAIAQAQAAIEQFTEQLRRDKRAQREAARATEAGLLALAARRGGESDGRISGVNNGQREALLVAQQRASAAERDLRLLQPGSYPPATTIGIAVVEAADGSRRARCTSANVGDTRIQVVGPGAAGRNLSRDHSIVPELIDSGVPEKTALLSPLAHALTSCLQAGNDPIPHVHISELAAGETVLVDSDGIWNDTPDPAELAAALHPDGHRVDPLAAALRLRDIAVAGGGRDNATVVVISGAATTGAEPGQGDGAAAHPDRAAAAWQWARVRVAPLPRGMPAETLEQYQTVLAAHRQAAAQVYRAAEAFGRRNPAAEVSVPRLLAPESFASHLARLPAGVGRTHLRAAVEDYHRLAEQVTDFAAWVDALPAQGCWAADRDYAAAMARFAAAHQRLCQAEGSFRRGPHPEDPLRRALREFSRAQGAVLAAKALLVGGARRPECRRHVTARCESISHREPAQMV